MREIQYYDYRFDNPRFEAVYITDCVPGEFSPACGISPDISPNARRAREIECRAYAAYPEEFGFTERVMRVAGGENQADGDTVRALCLVIEDEAPDWVASVWRARAFCEVEAVEAPDDAEVSLLTGIPLQVVAAASKVLTFAL